MPLNCWLVSFFIRDLHSSQFRLLTFFFIHSSTRVIFSSIYTNYNLILKENDPLENSLTCLFPSAICNIFNLISTAYYQTGQLRARVMFSSVYTIWFWRRTTQYWIRLLAFISSAICTHLNFVYSCFFQRCFGFNSIWFGRRTTH